MIIIAIEQNKFNYLYKYNEILVDKVHVVEIDSKELVKDGTETKGSVRIFDQMLPYFEEDHEVILLEVNKKKIRLDDRCLVYFDAVLSIYPLTVLGSKLLEGRLNPKFRIHLPVFEHIIEAVKLQRSLHTRLETIKVLTQYFGLEVDAQETVLAFLYDVAKNVVGQKEESSYFEHLLSYNKTPSYVPEGNIEYLCKIGIVAMRSLGQNEDSIVKGPFYKSCLANKTLINEGDLFESYEIATQLPDDSFQKSFKKINETISKNVPEVDVFRISYFFIAFRSILINNEKNLEKIQREIKHLVENQNETAKWVIALLGFAFSFENFYESIHSLKRAPLFVDDRQHQDHEPIKIVKEPSSSVTRKESEIVSQPVEQVHVEETTPVLLLSTDSVLENKQEQKNDEIAFPLTVQTTNIPPLAEKPRMMMLKKSILFEKIQKILEKKDAKAWIKYLDVKFRDTDELSWPDVKLSITKSKAKHFKESNQNHVRNFFEE